MKKDFWSNSVVAVLGGGSWGSVLASMVAQNAREVRVWVRDEGLAREMNSNHVNSRYLPDFRLPERLKAYSEIERVLNGEPSLVIWALPSKVTRELARQFAPYFRGSELILHATKGIEDGTMKRISQILTEELPIRRVGVISGPNLATEISRGEPSATVVASRFIEVVEAGEYLLKTPYFRVYPGSDVAGVEWAGTLKNVYALASGMLDALSYGQNARALLLTRGLAEMVRFGKVMGAQEATFLGLAGVGDLFATCNSALSRNYRVGKAFAEGAALDVILKELKLTAEGVRTTQIVSDFAKERNLDLPIAEAVRQILYENAPVKHVLRELMERPLIRDH
jgi:glycerol-3-phosphate dehydrogenase (NAD(P)+)